MSLKSLIFTNVFDTRSCWDYMTLGHLVFAIATTGYLYWSMVRRAGSDPAPRRKYKKYPERVRMLIPIPKWMLKREQGLVKLLWNQRTINSNKQNLTLWLMQKQ